MFVDPLPIDPLQVERVLSNFNGQPAIDDTNARSRGNELFATFPGRTYDIN
jgi:hypothetical protein